MTEAEWLTTDTKPVLMLRHVRDAVPARKLQLVAAGSCRLIWDRLPGSGLRAAVEALERYADGAASDDEFAEARSEYLSVEGRYDEARFGTGGEPGDEVRTAAVNAVSSALALYSVAPEGTERCLAWVCEFVIRVSPEGEKGPRWREVRRRMCDLLREVVGNPFRRWQVVPDWLGGGVVQPDGRTVRLTAAARKLAEGIHADQAHDRLPILADALEEAGVTDGELLAHCRAATGHVRGCWALDVVLGKG